ncbi:MAG: hypothetical protein Q9216_006253 [Gyalolechia sp. 2 TL-2023]
MTLGASKKSWLNNTPADENHHIASLKLANTTARARFVRQAADERQEREVSEDVCYDGSPLAAFDKRLVSISLTTVQLFLEDSLHDGQHLMSIPYRCLQCGHKRLQGRLCTRSLSYVSLHQNSRQSNGLREDRKAQPILGEDGPRSRNDTETGSGGLRRPTKRVSQPALGSDSVLEALFSSQSEKPRESSRTRHSGTPINRPTVERGIFEPRETAELQRSTVGSEQSNDGTGLGVRLDRIITGLQRQEKEIADLIAETKLSMREIGTSTAVSEESVTFRYLPGPTRNWDDKSKARRVTTLIKDLERATQRYDVARVTQLWQKYQQSPDNTQLDCNSRETIYIHFLSAFFTFSRQEQAIQVWNDMLQAGITPNEKHWNAMLKGCSKAHDVASLQEIWTNMISTGIEPDQILYTTYIHGLILCGRWSQGLKVLDHLGAKWTAAKKQSQKPTKQPQPQSPLSPNNNKYDPNTPSLAPVQAAITALTVTQRHSLCLPLVTWATTHSLRPTTEIFNILLRPAVRTNDTEKISQIFSLMKTHDCPADEATYTILLDGHMSNHNNSNSNNTTFSLLSPREQRDSILRILDDMTAHKISIDKRTYGTILRGLLLSPERSGGSGGESNDEAARAVLAHMAQHAIAPDSYIYHMLITHHFSRSPPDIPAVEAIWARIKRERPSLQSVFYEKMVEGYASVRAVERMMFFLRRIGKEGNSPRWGCLLTVLHTLVEVGEWGLVRELVADARDARRGLMRYADGNAASRAKGEFWGVVEEIGV